MSLDINFTETTRTSASFEFSWPASEQGAGVVTAVAGEESHQATLDYSGPSVGGGVFTGLTAGTTYTIYANGTATATTFTTLPDDPKIAKESQWEDLVGRVKGKEAITLTGSAAPTTSTAGTNVGQQYYDSTNDKWYRLKAIDTSTTPATYTWEEQGGGGGGITTLTTADYDYPSNNPTAINANNLGDGIYIAGEQISVHMSLYGNSTFTKGGMIIKSDGAFLTHLSGTNSWAWKDSFSSMSLYNLLSVENLAGNLTSTDGTKALSAPQGKVLNEKIEGRVLNGGTTAPTTSTVGSVGTLYSCVNSGTPEIYICTAVSGSTYTWTKIN